MSVDFIIIRKTLSKQINNIDRYKYLTELYESFQNDEKNEFLLWFEHDFLNKLNSEIKKYSKILDDLSSIISINQSLYEFYQSWLNEIKLKSIKSYSNTIISKPFRDNDSKEFFEYIVNNWDKKTTSRWGYLWNFIVDFNNGKLTNKTDYEEYLRINNYLVKGKPNYESCSSKKVYLELEELLEKYKKYNLDLN